jgi:alpha-galactosidase
MVLGHGARLLRVTPQGEIEPASISYEAEAATLTGSAATCSACSGGTKVVNIGGASQVIFNNIYMRKGGIYRMEIDARDRGFARP